MRARELLGLLSKSPLGYEVTRRKGSHRVLDAPGRPRLIFAFHDGQTVGPAMVKKILTRDVGLTEDQARELL